MNPHDISWMNDRPSLPWAIQRRRRAKIIAYALVMSALAIGVLLALSGVQVPQL